MNDRTTTTEKTRRHTALRHLYMHVINLINWQSRKALTKQLFLSDKQLEYWGVSENGRRSLHDKNLSIGTTTYNRHNTDFIANCRAENKQTLSEVQLSIILLQSTSRMLSG